MTIPKKFNAGTTLITLALLLLTGVLHISQFNKPVNPPNDGVWLLRSALEYQSGELQPATLVGYPPLTFWIGQISHEVQLALNPGAPAPLIVPTIYTLRFLAGIASVISAYLIIRCAEYLGNRQVGYIAVLGWAAAPEIIDFIVISITEPWQHLSVMLACYFMLRAFKYANEPDVYLSTVAATAAIVAKYSAFPALIMPALVTMRWLYLKQYRQGIRVLVIQILIVGSAALWLFTGYDAGYIFTNPGPEMTSLLNSGVGWLWDVSFLAYILEIAASMLGLPGIVFVAVVVIGLAVRFVQSEAWQRWSIAAIVLMNIFWLLLIGAYFAYVVGIWRYTTPVTGLLALSFALGFYTLIETVCRRLKLPRQVQYVVTLIAVLLWVVPTLRQSLSDVDNVFQQHDEEIIIPWLAERLPPGTILIQYNDWSFFHYDWMSYTGAPRPYVQMDVIDKSAEEWEALFVEYALTIDPLPEDNSYGTLLLKKIVPDGVDIYGTPRYIYTVKPPQKRFSARFDDKIHLIAADFEPDPVLSPEDTLRFRLYWQAETTPAQNYQLYVHLVAEDSRDVLAQVDTSPALPTAPTSTWTDPEEVLLSEYYDLHIPADLDPGTYRLLAGLYDPNTGQRLLTDAGDDFVVLESITIE